MPLYLGVLDAAYRRQLRRPSWRSPLSTVLEKVARLAQEFHVDPIGLDFALGRVDAVTLRELKARLHDLHVLPTLIIGTVHLHADQDVAGPALRHAIANLEVAKALASPLGLFYFNYGGRVTRAGRIRLAVEQLRVLADAAATHGITVTTENYDWFTSDEFLQIFEQVSRPNLGLHNDTGNWLLLGEDPVAATRKLADYTYHAHVRDYVLRGGVFSSVPIGEGLVDVPGVLAELEQIGRRRDRFVLAAEMDLDEGDEAAEDEAVRRCVGYLADWRARERA